MLPQNQEKGLGLDLRAWFGDLDIYLFDQLLKGRFKPPMRLLDAGCGTGYNALELQRNYSLQTYTVDIAPLAIQYCRTRQLQRSAVGSVTSLPFEDATFDLVTSFDVLFAFPLSELDIVLRELNRVLRPGGLMFIRVAAFHCLRSRHSQWTDEQHRYRAAELLNSLTALNLRVQKWSYANAFLAPIAFLKFRVWENLRNAPPASGVAAILPAWLNNLLTGILATEAALIGHGFRFPFGQSLMVVARKPEAH